MNPDLSLVSQSHQVYVVNKDVKKAGDSNKHPREPATVHMVTLPRTGLIKLTGLAYEFDNPGYYDDRKERECRVTGRGREVLSGRDNGGEERERGKGLLAMTGPWSERFSNCSWVCLGCDWKRFHYQNVTSCQTPFLNVFKGSRR